MAQKITRKELKHDEFVEAGMEAGEWLEEHWRTVTAGAAGVLAVVLLFVGWNWWSEDRQAKAGRLAAEGFALLAPPQPGVVSGVDPAAAALKYEDAATTAGESPLGDVARTYRAVALLRAGRAAEAVPLLEDVGGSVDQTSLFPGPNASQAGSISSSRARAIRPRPPSRSHSAGTGSRLTLRSATLTRHTRSSNSVLLDLRAERGEGRHVSCVPHPADAAGRG